MSSKNTRLVTLPLDILVNDLLADYDCRTISPEVAEILRLVNGDGKGNYHVQFPGEHEVDINGVLIESPRLWSLRHWQVTAEKNNRARLKTQKDREIWMIKQANIKLISKYLLKLAMLNPEAAQVISRMMLDKGETDKIQAIIGGRKLYTNIKEIP